MKLEADQRPALNTVISYGHDFVNINDIHYHQSVLILPEGPIDPWNCSSFQALSISDFETMAQKKPHVVILGSGKKISFPKPELLRPLIQAKIGFETMDLQAACRTYNILMAEGRNVLGAFIIENSAYLQN